MHQRALEQISHRGQPDMRMRPYVNSLARIETHGAHVIKKDEWTDGAPRRGGQQTSHLETVTEVFGMRLQSLNNHDGVDRFAWEMGLMNGVDGSL